MTTVSDWNAVASTGEGAYTQARALLKALGKVGDTRYHNVLVLRVGDVRAALEALRGRAEADPEVRRLVPHFVPLSVTFGFMSPGEFASRAGDAVLALVPQLAGKRFYVRMHRRGFKGRLVPHEQERRLGDVILAALAGSPVAAQVGFDDPDAVLVVETGGQRAGLAVWTRQDLERYPFLHVGS